jgi:hypothetical protein
MIVAIDCNNLEEAKEILEGATSDQNLQNEILQGSVGDIIYTDWGSITVE